MAQLELALAGRVEFVYGYSFILTDLDGAAAEIELWHRQRGQMEERVKELKLGDGLLHFPLGSMNANRAWQTAAVIAHNLVALLSAVVGDVNHRRLREQLEQSPVPPPRPAASRVAVHNTKLVRRWLLAVPGRVLHSGRRVVLRLADGLLWASPPSSPSTSASACSPPAPDDARHRDHSQPVASRLTHVRNFARLHDLATPLTRLAQSRPLPAIRRHHFQRSYVHEPAPIAFRRVQVPYSRIED
jgi:hypothetical protein